MEYSLPDDTLDGPYGVSFSPNSEFFYVGVYYASAGAPANNPIYQYDLSSNDSAVIVGSETQVNPSGTGTNGALQIAPNDKVHITNVNSSNLDVINDPNNAGTACNFSDDQVTLSSGMVTGGLPNFVRAFKDQGSQVSYSSNILCSPSDSITLDAPPGDSIAWSLGAARSIRILIANT